MIKQNASCLGARIKELRQAQGWSQAELAERMGVSRPSVTQWESGSTKNLKHDNLLSLSGLFRVPVEALLIGPCPQAQRQCSTLSRDEESVLESYRRLSPEDQSRLRGIITALAQSEPKD